MADDKKPKVIHFYAAEIEGLERIQAARPGVSFNQLVREAVREFIHKHLPKQ